MNKNGRLFLISFGVLLLALTYLFVGKTKRVPSGDETISYLCATGNQELYGQVLAHRSVYGRDSEAAEWKAFLSNHPGSFGHIAPDLTKTDLHPPLYFWLLHFFTLLPVGIFTSGLLLNFLLHAASLFVLLKICRQLELLPLTVFFVVMGWCLSPAVIGVGFYARQYELLGLLNLLVFATFIQYRHSGKPVLLVVMLLLTALGMLTHYLFIYFSFAYTGFALLVERDRKLTLNLLRVNLLALALMVSIHPGIFNQFGLQQERAQAFASSEIAARVGKTILAFAQVLVPVLSLKPFLLTLPKTITALVSVVVISGVGFLVFRNRNRLDLRKMDRTAHLILWMFLFGVALAVLPYLLFLTPFHSMGGQYLVLVYPYLLIMLGVFLRRNVKVLAVVLSLMGVGFVLQLAMLHRQHVPYRVLLDDVNKSDVIVVNSANRRGFLRLVPALTRQQVILDEQALPCSYPGQQVLFISEDPVAVSKQECTIKGRYDLEDGVVFYTVLTSSCACAEPRSK